MNQNYLMEDAIQSYNWLGHKEVTELNAYHPEYKPGKENYEWNKDHRAYTRIWYAKDEKGLTGFIERYGETHLLCYSLNPRKSILKKNGYARSALESEIEKSKNLLIDLDLYGDKTYLNERLAQIDLFLEKGKEYFLDLSLLEPIQNDSGEGNHLLFAYPEIEVKDVPDIKDRLKYFVNEFKNSYKQELDRLEAKIDSTQDLRRMVKMYGTSKPGKKISRWHGPTKRIEDIALREHLLNLNVPEPTSLNTNFNLNIKSELPPYFIELLEKENSIRELWEGKGKKEGDVSSSGFDFSLIQKLIKDGYTDIGDLATILALRPDGSFNKNKKQEIYLKRTIGNALIKS